MASLLPVALLLMAFLNGLRIGSCRKVELKVEAKLEPVVVPKNATSSPGFDPSKVIPLSWHPRTFLYKGFLLDEECDHLISLARDKLDKPLVTDSDIGKSTASTGMFLARSEDEIVAKIEERISAWTFLPKENGEEMQVTLGRVNDSYAPQYDYYQDKSKLANGGHRIATILMYLSNVTRGGETIFPKSEFKDTQTKGEAWSDCASTSYAVKPSKGDALLFFSLHLNATTDESSLYGGCMVLEGEKWSATKWIHVRAFDPGRPLLSSDDDCTDEDDNCSHWAAIGECQRNSVYMLGTPDYYGSCRKSCGAC